MSRPSTGRSGSRRPMRRGRQHAAGGGLLLLAAAACGPLGGQTEALVDPDVIYHNGKVVTVDPAFSIAEGFAIAGDRFVAVGSSAEMLALAGPDTRIVDLGGRTVLPGLYDNHVHLGDQGQRWRGAIISATPEWIRGADTMEKLAERLAAKARETPPGEWIVGGLTREEWPNQLIPTRWQLDEMAPDHPVALTRGPHTVILNSKAFEVTGITRDTPDPPGGWIVRDENGEPSGRILETAKRLVDPFLPRTERPQGSRIDGIRSGLTDLLSLGITSVNVAGVRPDGLADLQRLYEEHGEELPRMTVQLRVSPGYDSHDDPVLGAKESIAEIDGLAFRTGFGDDRLKIGAIKMSIDGGLSAPVMWTKDHYHGRPDFHGVQRIPDETFYEVAKFAHDRGWQLGVHTIGDAAVEMVVRQIARIVEESPREDHRHYVHHMNVTPSEETLRTMARIGMMAAVHPSWTTNLGAYAEEAIGGGEKLEHQNPSRTLLNHGIRISYGSDGLPYSPIFAIWNAVTRRGWDGKVYGPEEAVTVEEAIRIHTMGTAFQTFDEENRGSIESGKLADFVILGEDILTVDPERIFEVPVEATVIGGREVYRATN